MWVSVASFAVLICGATAFTAPPLKGTSWTTWTTSTTSTTSSTSSRTSSTSTTTTSDASPSALRVDNFLGDLPNPFAKAVESLKPQPDAAPAPADPVDPNSTEGLIAKAKAVLASDLGIQDASLLADDFRWIGPMQEQPLGKTDYLAAGKFFDLRSTFPDLDYRPHDFRIDERDPRTVRVTVRTVGTMRGALRLRKERIQPTGARMACPPEAVAMTFDPRTGKLVKLCSGFAMDRLVGNTDGLCGVMAAAAVAGAPPSDWELYPIPTLVSRFFGRPAPRLEEAASFLAPFPETVMVQLTKGILAASLGADDPTLLSDKSFMFYTPTVGPVNKRTFLESYAREEFTNPEISHVRVDPYDPYRVWVDVKPVGPGLEGPPQAVSFTYDDDGFCTRISASAVMDPTIGNTGGLTGAEGARYAAGEAAPGIATRPLPLAIGRLKKAILSPITKVGVDEFDIPSSSRPALLDGAKADVPKPPLPPTPPVASSLSDALSKLEMPAAPLTPLARQQQSSGETNQAQAQAERKRMQAQKEQAERKRQEAQKARQAEEAQQRARAEKQRQEQEQRKIKGAVQEERKPNPTLSLLENLVPKAPPSPPKTAPKVAAKAAKMAVKKVAKPAGPSPAELKKQKEEAARLAKEKKEEAEKLAEQKKKEMAIAAEEARKKQAEARKRIMEQRKQEAQRKADEAAARQQKLEEQKAERAKQQQDAIAKQKSVFGGLQRGTGSSVAPTNQAALKNNAANIRNQKLEEQKAESARMKLEAAEKKKAAQEARLQAAQEKRVEIERKKQEAAAKREAAQEARRQAAEAKKAEAESKRQAAAAKAASPKKAPATSARFGLPKSTKMKSAPAGVPTIVSWNERRDGGITGRIFGSVNFREGERVETSVITQGEIENNSVVTTESGSRYYLSEKTFQDLKNENKVTAQKELAVAPPRATIRLTQFAKEKDAKAAQEAIQTAQPRATFSLSNLFGGGNDSSEEENTPSSRRTAAPKPAARRPAKPSTPAVTKKAPKGVPSIKRWRQNRDKSITGLITGSPSFPEGERITTSPIAKGEIQPGEVVTTSSGSRYFLL